MRTSELAARPVFDSSFLRYLVWAIGATPGILLGWDAVTHHLGVNAVNYAIRTTGMLALVFLVLALAVTPLRKLTGTPMLIATRRSLGLFSFGYLALHVAMFYALDRGASLSSTLHEILTRRYLQIGTLALVFMIVLAITSTDSAVKRLGAKRWKRLHRLVYAVGVLGCIHYFMLVKADVRQPLVFAGVVAILLAYRAFTFRRARERVERPWSGELRVLSTKQETKDVRTLRLGNPSGGALPFAFAPGQYLNVSFEIDGKPVRRSYTIASSSEQRGHCEITVRKTDDGWVSRHVHERLSEGDRVAVTAPGGRFVFDPIGHERVTLIGGGVGITPLMSIVRSMTDRAWRGRMEMILSMRSAEEIIFAEELIALVQRFQNLRVTISLTRGAASEHRQGRLTKEALAEILGGAPAGPIYLCGPEAMMRDVRASLVALGVNDGSILTEAFVSPKTSSADAGGDEGHEVSFEQQGIVTRVPRALTLLEGAENAGLDLPFECWAGVCGQCKLRVLQGEVTMDNEDALSPAEKVEGIVLACQAHPSSDVVVDA